MASGAAIQCNARVFRMVVGVIDLRQDVKDFP